MEIQIVMDTYMYKYTYTCIHVNVIFWLYKCGAQVKPLTPWVPQSDVWQMYTGGSLPCPTGQSWPWIFAPFVLKPGLERKKNR